MIDLIRKQKILPLHSHTDSEVMKQVIGACYDAGMRCFEFTNRTPNAAEVFYELKKYAAHQWPDMKLGVGTIKNSTDAETFLSAGAEFLVSPIISVELIEFTQPRNVFWIPGCSTASEIGMAENAGIHFVKIFPVSLLGGVAFIKAMRDVFPHVGFLPTGGIKADKMEIANWLLNGADAVGLGSQLFKKDRLMVDELTTTLRGLL